MRTGQSYIVDWIRDTCAVGTADYDIDGVYYWSDAQIVANMEARSRYMKYIPLRYTVTLEDGTAYYYDYRLPFTWFEDSDSGTPYFRLYDTNGEDVGSALYEVYPTTGEVHFLNDTEGSAYFADIVRYPIFKIAADIWRKKAAQIAECSFDIKVGGHTITRSQRIENYLSMADYYENAGGMNSIPMARTDMGENYGARY
jgi:hypothetical protein